RRFLLRHGGRLEFGAIGPTVDILNDFLVARAMWFGRLRFIRELARELDVLCHGRFSKRAACASAPAESRDKSLFLLSNLTKIASLSYVMELVLIAVA